MKLIAKSPILWKAKQYRIGDELPASDPEMVDAWISAGSAVWVDPDKEPEPAKKVTKAKQAVADPGIEGRTDSGPELQGKVPKTPARSGGKKQGEKK